MDTMVRQVGDGRSKAESRLDGAGGRMRKAAKRMGNSMDRMPQTGNLGGTGDTDDLAVVGMVDQGDGGGIGVISSDNGATRRPSRHEAATDGRNPGRGMTARRKPLGGAVGGSRKDKKKADGDIPSGKATEPGGNSATGRDSLAPKILVACLVVFLGALVGIWAYGRAHYSEHLFPGRMVDGVNVSGMTASEAEAATSVDRWSFVIDDQGKHYELGASDVGFETEDIDYAGIIADQDVNLWFLHVIAPEKNEAIRKSTYDSKAVHDSIMNLPCVKGERKESVDATVKRSEEGFSYVIVPEEEGNVVKTDIVEEAVEKALSEGQNGAIDLEKSDAYIRPAVYADNKSLGEAVDTANKWLKTNITYDIDGLESVETLGPETISQWIDIVRDNPEGKDQPKPEEEKDEEHADGEDGNEGESEENGEESKDEQKDDSDDGESDSESDEKSDENSEGSARQVFGRNAPTDGGGMFYQVNETVLDDGIRVDTTGGKEAEPTFRATFNDEGLRGWLSGIGEEYDTVGKPRSITTPDGNVKEVSGGGSYGWITDEASEFDAIKASLETGEQTHREFAMKQRAALPKGQNEWGNTYIEIDLSAQHLWYVRNGEAILSFGVITGKSGYETPTMVSQVYNKVTDIVLISPWKDANGQPTYKTHIDVGLVISDDGGILCHDAPWQPWSGFGSSGYHWSGGSHGCCNMRTGDCWELYNTANVGDPVVVHY